MKRRILYLFLSIALCCFSIIPFFSLKNTYTASAAGENYKEITSEVVYLLPAINVTYSPTNGVNNYIGVVPSVLVGFNRDGTFDCIYTMTARGSRDNYYWGRRDFILQDDYQGEISYRSSSGLSLVIQYQPTSTSTVGGNINWSTSRYAYVFYSPSGNDSILFDMGSFAVEPLDTSSVVHYYMTGFSGISFKMSLYFNNGSTLMEYTGTFSPTSIVTNADSGNYSQGYDVGYKKGYDVGKDYGEALGYQKGVDDANLYSFGNLISAVIDVPINSFKSLLNFDFLGINLLDFSLALLTFVLIVKIVGLILGG